MLEQSLIAYRDRHGVKNKGKLAVVLHITRLAIEHGLPILPEMLRTEKEGQVKGLGKSRIQSILKSHGISRVLAEEGGRTSRGSLGNASNYAKFLNELHDAGFDDLQLIEDWWIARVLDYFNSKPFILRFDSSKSFHYIIYELIAQAIKRQKNNPGTTYVGTMLQHLVGAKLDLILPAEKKLKHYGANVADMPTSRLGDFVLDNVSIHVTSAPSESLIRKCKANIESGMRPIIISISDCRPGIESIAKGLDIDGRIDILEIEQFLVANFLEWCKFEIMNYQHEITKLINRYNEIIEITETDMSLKINI